MPSCKKLLIVEDDEAIRHMMQDVLEIEGYEIVVAADGQEGIELLGASDEAPCVIILDMMMPRMNGWQFLDQQRLNPKYAGIPVIICSAYTESAKAVKPSAFVAKPVQLPVLTSAVRAFCA
jgi:two-component system response regulator MprA